MCDRVLFCAIAATLLATLTGCGADVPGAMVPDEAPDARIVGPGMRSSVLPHWPMFRHDARHSGHSVMAPPARATLAWSFSTQGEIWSSPAVAIDGTVSPSRHATPD